MPVPGSRMEHLWRRLADAQDAALLADAPAVDAPAARPSAVARGRWPGRSRLRARAGVVWTGAVALGVAGAAVAAALLLGPSAELHFQLGRTGQRGAPGRTLVADARSDLPLAFSDGSTVIFRAGSAGRVQRLTGKGADVVLDRGLLDVHVVHADATLWLVHAGPFQVRVTGTRFVVSWSSSKLDLALTEGSVVVDGALRGAGVPLQAGQKLTIEAGVVRIDALPAASSPARTIAAPSTTPAAAVQAAGAPAAAGLPAAPSLGAPSAPAPPPAASPALASPATTALAPSGSRAPAAPFAGDRDWLALAAMGAHREAFEVASRLGWANLCRRLDSGRLLTLADVARYAGAPVQARRAFEALVARFPHERSTADAVFTLGRLAYEAHQPNRAARWFRRYVDGWSDGPLADQAAGRLLECAVRSDHREEARRAARAYLTRAPDGPHASLAREVLGDNTAGDGAR